MTLPKNNTSVLALFLIAASLLFFNLSFLPNNILSWDVFGYYMYLPMIFIYKNWGLQDLNIVHTILDQYHNSSTLYQAYQTETGFWIMRYSSGMAILFAPFFFIGHLVASLAHYPQDGFSAPYQMAILAGGIFYSLLGFYFLRKILLRYYTDGITALTLFILYFGTNYFMHSSFHGSNAMTHNYLFTVYALILWFTIKWYETFRLRYILLLGLACGINIMARPSEIVCLLIPLIWQTGTRYSLMSKWQLLLKMKMQVLLFLAVLFVVAMPQLIYWKIIAGKFLFNSYGNNPGEGFEFAHPYLREVLFSFRKGWLLYTPAMLLAIAGLYFSIKARKEFSYAIVIYFVINLYIVSSWSCWWYAESFSQRSIIQSYSLMALPLGSMLSYLYTQKKKLLNYAASIVIIVFIALNLFQTWQFLHGIIHPSRMTKAAYTAVFGKTKLPEGWENLLLIDRAAENASAIDPAKYISTKAWTEGFENDAAGNKEFSFSGMQSFKLDSAIAYSKGIEKRYDELTEKDHAKLKISMHILLTADAKSNPGSLIATFEHKGYSYGYASLDLENLNLELNKWTEVSMNYLTPVIRTKEDKLKVYFWNRGKAPIYIDDLKVEAWEPKN